MTKNWPWYLLSLLLIGADQISKSIAIYNLPLYKPMTFFPGLNWTLMFNSGSAFGFLNRSDFWWSAYLLTGFGLLMSVGLIIWIGLYNSDEKIELLGLSFILSGAIGNVIDRLHFGYVVDFIQVYYGEHYFPVFNLADSAICVGAALLFFMNYKSKFRS